MASSLDIATALDHVLGDPNTEAKFQALKTLHAKKIKSLMSSIDTKERDLDRQKALGKDNRRTEIIQSLKKKLKHHELVINVMKEELMKKAEMTYEEVNMFIIGKTISGPKRFRPLIREELENQITDLEKKLELERKMRSKLSVSGPAGGANGTGGAKTPNKPSKNASMGNATTPVSSSGGGGDVGEKRSGKEADLHKMLDISDLQDQIIGLRQEITNRDDIISKQKEELFRVRSSNASLHSLEEEVDTLERAYKELTLVHQRTTEDLEDSVHQLASCQEEKHQLQANAEHDLEQAALESEHLSEECQKGLKQNAQLLRLMSNLESKMTNKNINSGNSNANNRSSSPSRSTPSQATVSDVEHNRLNEKLKAATARIQELEGGVTSSYDALLALKETLREKNEVIRELKRNIAEISRHQTVVSNGNDKNTTNSDKNTKLDLTADAKSAGRGDTALSPRDRDRVSRDVKAERKVSPRS